VAHELDLSVRAEGFGCSELGAALGFDPFRDQHALYVQKMEGLLVPPTKRMRAGKFFEEATLRAFVELTGIKMEPSFNKTFKHPEFSKYHVFGTPDGLGDDCGYEGKTAGWDRRGDYGPPDDAVPWLPPHHELQVRGNMEVTGKSRWYLGVWFGFDQFLIYTFERDRPFGTFIMEQAEQVWQRYFETRERPPIGGNRISTEWLKQRWSTHKRPDIRPATNAEIALLDRYAQVRVEEKKWKKEKDVLENKLKDAVQDREGLSWPHGVFTWRKTKDGTEIRWMDMAIGLRQQHLKTEEDRQNLTEFYTVPKPGHRCVRFTWDGEEVESEEAVDAA
jgi:predicted phage-related endonuclease